MSRHRYISTDMGGDEKVEALATKGGPFAALLYTLLIPHLDDWGRMDGRVREIKHKVVPGIPSTAQDIDAALTAMHEVGLLVRYEVGKHPYIAVDQERFWRHQTYLKKDRREKDESKIPAPSDPSAIIAEIAHIAEIAEIAHSAPGAEIAEKVALSPFPSPSSSPSSPPSVGADGTAPMTVQEQIGAVVEDFESAVGRKVTKSERGILASRTAKHGIEIMAKAVREMRATLTRGAVVGDPGEYVTGIVDRLVGAKARAAPEGPVAGQNFTQSQRG